MFIFCHTRASSSSENLASFSLQDGATKRYYFLAWTTPHPPTHPPTAKLFLSMLCGVPTPIVPPINKVCAVSPPIFLCCAVSPPHVLLLSTKYVRCPPLPVYIFSVRCPPQCSFFFTLALSWILSKIENLASSSLQDKA